MIIINSVEEYKDSPSLSDLCMNAQYFDFHYFLHEIIMLYAMCYLIFNCITDLLMLIF